nr:ABC transporter substrate-binding protein [Lachnospiraceae bacterium]
MKKFLSLLLASAMTVSMLAGCADAGAASTDAQSSSAEAETASADSSASGATFKIGGIGPITGGAAVYGLAVMNAAQIAVDEINAAGGINGYQIEYNF